MLHISQSPPFPPKHKSQGDKPWLFSFPLSPSMGFLLEVARYLGVTTSAVNRLALSKELPDLEKSRKLF
jgi:hypothetical protein